MQVNPPDDSWKDNRYPGDGHRGDPAKASNRLSAAKAGVPGVPVPVAGGDRDPHLRRSGSTSTRRVPRLELSLTQILGSTGAAVTAAFLGSRLGVAGTLIGAALASVISVVGGALYTTSLKATRQRVSKVLVGRTDDDATDGPGSRSRPPLPAGPSAAGRSAPGARAGATPVRPGRWGRPALRGAVAGVLLSAAVFTGALLVVTGVESVTGSALSGGSAGSLTILGGNDAHRSDTGPGVPASGSTTKPSPTTGAAPAVVGTPAPGAGASTTAESSTAGSSTGPGAVNPATTVNPSTPTPTSTGSSATLSTTGTTPVETTPTTGTAATTPVGTTPPTRTAATTPVGPAGTLSPGTGSGGTTADAGSVGDRAPQ